MHQAYVTAPDSVSRVPSDWHSKWGLIICPNSEMGSALKGKAQRQQEV